MKEKLANLPQELKDIFDELEEMAFQMHDADKFGTENPIFCAQERRRIIGVIPEYTEIDDPIYVLNDDVEFTFNGLDELTEFLESEDNEEGYTEDDFTPFYYTDTWEDVQWFFTEQAAKDFISSNIHRYEELRMYVKSLYRNKEMLAVEKLLKYLQE